MIFKRKTFLFFLVLFPSTIHFVFMQPAQQGGTTEEIRSDARASSLNSFTSHMSGATKGKRTEPSAAIQEAGEAAEILNIESNGLKSS